MSKILFEAKAGTKTIFNLCQRDNGYFIVERPSPNIVAIIAVTPEDNLVLVKQYREGINDYCIELPSGLDDKSETLLQTALEELEEETGYTAESLDTITVLPKSPGMTNERLWLFWANNIKQVSAGGGLKEEGENIEVIEVPTRLLFHFLMNSRVPIATSVFAAALIIQQRKQRTT